jgi:hypothetical protein
MKLLYSALAVVSIGFHPLFAQEDSGDGAKKRGAGRLAWFVASSIPENLENPVKVMTEGKITEVLLSTRQSSDPVKIPADNVISLVKEIEGPKDPSKPPYHILAKATIPEQYQKVLIVLVPTGKAPGEGLAYQSKVENLADFKGGDYYFLNLTKANVAVRMGSEKLTLKPGETTISRASALTESVNTPISYHFFHPVKEQWLLISASTVVRMPSRREICVFSWDERFQRISYKGITFPVTQ